MLQARCPFGGDEKLGTIRNLPWQPGRLDQEPRDQRATRRLTSVARCLLALILILHDDRKPLDRWLHEQSRYAKIEAKHLLESPNAQLNLPDRLRKKIIVAPVLVFLYTLLTKGLILDGWPGWYYVLQRTLAEIILSLRLIEAKLKAKFESDKVEAWGSKGQLYWGRAIHSLHPGLDEGMLKS